MGGAPVAGGAGGELAADGLVASDAGVDVEQVSHAANLAPIICVPQVIYITSTVQSLV
jgi:hypothetical protein